MPIGMVKKVLKSEGEGAKILAGVLFFEQGCESPLHMKKSGGIAAAR